MVGEFGNRFRKARECAILSAEVKQQGFDGFVAGREEVLARPLAGGGIPGRYSRAVEIRLAVDEVQPEVALDLSLLPRRQKVVAVGLETGLRWVPVERVDWWSFTARLAVHY